MNVLAHDAEQLYRAHERALGLPPWYPGEWRQDVPTPKQRRTLRWVADADLSYLTPNGRRLLQQIADDPDGAGKGAVADILAVSKRIKDRARRSHRSTHAITPPTPVNASLDAERCDLARQVLSADGPTLARIRRAMGAA